MTTSTFEPTSSNDTENVQKAPTDGAPVKSLINVATVASEITPSNDDDGHLPEADCPVSSNSTPDAYPPTSADQPLSKKALKRQLKTERFQASKLERRAREKAAKKEKKRARRERFENGEQDSADEEVEEREKKRRKIRKADKEDGARKGDVFNARVVVDLGFDGMMSEKVCCVISWSFAFRL